MTKLHTLFSPRALFALLSRWLLLLAGGSSRAATIIAPDSWAPALSPIAAMAQRRVTIQMRTGAEVGYNQFVPERKYALIDDHTAFLNAGIPVDDSIDFDYPDWNTTSETIDKVGTESQEAVGRAVEDWRETRAQP